MSATSRFRQFDKGIAQPGQVNRPTLMGQDQAGEQSRQRRPHVGAEQRQA